MTKSQKENIRIRFQVKADIDKELKEVRQILDGNAPDDVKFRSISAIFNELSKEIIDAKLNAMFESRTGLLSAKFGEEMIDKEIDLARRTGEKFSIALLDIDFLKYINDNFGHVVGTNIIVEVAKTLKKQVRKYDIICRYGGDEFLIIFPNTAVDKAKEVVARIIKKISKRKFDKKIMVTLSCGVAGCTGDTCTSDILKIADDELYKAKKKRINVNLDKK